MILYTLDIKKLKKQGIIYTIVTIACILFAIIYESFSHGVISNFMVYAFTIPLILGTGVCYTLYFFKIKKLPNKFENSAYNAAIATFTVGSIVEGILQIYGTTNWKVYVYLIVGIILLMSSIISYLVRTKDIEQNKT